MNNNKSRHLQMAHPAIYKECQRHLKRKSGNKECQSQKPWINGPWVRQYCVRLTKSHMKCKICNRVMPAPEGQFSNMKRHIMRRHPEEYYQVVRKHYPVEHVAIDSTNSDSSEVKLKDESDAPYPSDEFEDGDDKECDDVTVNLDENDPALEEKVKYLCDKPVKGKNNRPKSYVWNFFKNFKGNVVCIACKDTSAIPKHIGNMTRHIKRLHPIQYEFMLKHKRKEIYTTAQESLDTLFFDPEKDGQYKCKSCDDVIVCENDDQQPLLDHITQHHEEFIVTESDQVDEKVAIPLIKQEDQLS